MHTQNKKYYNLLVKKINQLENFTNELALEQAKLLENLIHEINYDKSGAFPTDLSSKNPQYDHKKLESNLQCLIMRVE